MFVCFSFSIKYCAIVANSSTVTMWTLSVRNRLHCQVAHLGLPFVQQLAKPTEVYHSLEQSHLIGHHLQLCIEHDVWITLSRCNWRSSAPADRRFLFQLVDHNIFTIVDSRDLSAFPPFTSGSFITSSAASSLPAALSKFNLLELVQYGVRSARSTRKNNIKQFTVFCCCKSITS